MIQVNGTEVPYTVRSGGEIDLALPLERIRALNSIDAFLWASEDLMALLLINQILKQHGKCIDVLALIYLPYARQDKVHNKGEPLSLKVVADLINNLGAKRVRLYDPHSDVATALINNSVVLDFTSFLDFKKYSEYTIIAPDQGAFKKLNKYNVRQACALKCREKDNSKLVIKEIVGDLDNNKFLILDDICDGGRTFIALYNHLTGLLRHEARIELHTTYGIYSNGFKDLEKCFDKISCAFLKPGVEIKSGKFCITME